VREHAICACVVTVAFVGGFIWGNVVGCWDVQRIDADDRYRHVLACKDSLAFVIRTQAGDREYCGSAPGYRFTRKTK